MIASYKVQGIRLGNNASWRVNTFFNKNEVFYVHLFNAFSFFPKSVFRFGRPTSKKNCIFYSRRSWNSYIFRRMKKLKKSLYRPRILYYPLRFFFFLPKKRMLYNFNKYLASKNFMSNNNYHFKYFLDIFKKFQPLKKDKLLLNPDNFNTLFNFGKFFKKFFFF